MNLESPEERYLRNQIGELRTELATALAANQRLEKERDEARAMANLSSLAVDATFECFEDEGKECDQLRAQVARLTADNIAERDRLMADVVQYRRALEEAQTFIEAWFKAKNPHPNSIGTALEIVRTALAAEHPGAPLMEAVGKAYEYLDRIHKGDPVPADMLANNAKACLKQFLPLDEPSKPS